MDDKNSDWKEFNLPNNTQETELDKILQEHLVSDAVASHSEDVHHSSSDSEHSVHDTITSVLYIPQGATQQPESSPQSPATSPRPILTSQQSIVSGRFTRTSYASGDTGHVATPTRFSPLPNNLINPDTLEDKDENQDAPLEYGSSDSSVGDSTEYVESAQRTVTSMGALSTDTQDSARYDDAPFPCGNIHFWIGKMNMEESSTKKHYVTVSADTPSEEVTRFMGTYWKMRSPKIVLSVISGVKHFRPWKNNRLKEQFQKGITKVYLMQWFLIIPNFNPF